MICVKLDNICKKYGDKVIFDNYSLEIFDGEFICISGVSGKGKTTLLNMIGLWEQPNSGNIIIKGIKNPKLGKRSALILLRNEIAYVFQNYGLVEDRSVYYNLQISAEYSKHKNKKEYVSALHNVGLDESILNKKVYMLSGGEQQRVALARLYLKNCSIIIADEPTGSVDTANRDIIMNIFKQLNNNGKTIIIVTHDLEVAKCASRIERL